jgi:hypothetical protein
VTAREVINGLRTTVADERQNTPRDARRVGLRQTWSAVSCVQVARAELPVLHVNCGLRQISHLPRLATAAIPVDVRVSKGSKPYSKIPPVEVLGVPADNNKR